MKRQPSIGFTEAISSDTARPAFRGPENRETGAGLLDLQPYRSGVVNAPTILSWRGGETQLAFAISAENIYVRQTIDPAGRLLRETMVSPNHLIQRTYRYPANGTG